MPARRSVVALSVASLLLPSSRLTFGQEATPVGVVTRLEGTVTAVRAPLREPAPLKFRDDVFVRDRITTADRSLARLLLGGRAVVTLREHTTLQITEVPGRSTIDVEAGKIGVVVAREKMKPGEAIEIRSFNAIAGVRGTVVVFEVTPGGAPGTPGAGATTTKVSVLRDTADLTHLNPATGQPLGPSITLNPLQSASVSGTTPPRVTPIPPQQVGQIVADLHPKALPHTEAANHERVVTQSVHSAVALVTALVSGAAFHEKSLPIAEHLPPQRPPHQLPGGDRHFRKVLDDRPDVSITGTFTVAPGHTLLTYDHPITRSKLSPVVEIKNAILTQSAPEVLINQIAGTVHLASPLARIDHSAVKTAGRLFHGAGGGLTDSTPRPFVVVDTSSVTTGGQFAALTSGYHLTLNGPLLEATNSSLNLGGGLLGVFAGAQLSGTGTFPDAVTIRGGTHAIATTAGTAMLQLAGRSTATASEVDSGVLLTLGTDEPLGGGSGQVTDAGVLVSGATVSGEQFWRLDFALFNASVPILKLVAGSRLTTALDAINLNLQSKVDMRGGSSLVILDGATTTMTVANGAAVLVNGGSFLNVSGDLFQLKNGATLKMNNGPLLKVSGNSVATIGGALANFAGGAGNTVRIANGLCPCVSFSGVPVALFGGATAANVSIGPRPFPGLGSVILSNPSLSAGGTAAIVVNGPASKVTVSAP